MTTIDLTVTGAIAKAEVSGALTAGMTGIPVHISWDEEWEKLNKTLLCQSGAGTFALLFVQGQTTLPPEVLQRTENGKNVLFLGLEGRKADGTLVIPSTMAYCGEILPGAQAQPLFSRKQENGAWAQVLEKIGDLERLRTLHRTDLVTAINEAAGLEVGSSGYYLPAVTQADDASLTLAFAPSDSEMPAVEDVTVTLPAGPQGPQGEKGNDGAKGENGADGKTPVRGEDYWTSEDQALMRTQLNAYLSEELAKRSRLQPEFANSPDECTDTSRLYILPDGYIYAYMRQSGAQQITEPIVGTDDNPYTDNARIGSDGSVATGYSGYVTTPLIDLKAYSVPFTLHFDGVPYIREAMETYTKMCTYTAAKGKIHCGNHTAATVDSFFNISDSDVTVDDNGNATIVFSQEITTNLGEEIRYLRLSGKGTAAQSNIYVTRVASATTEQWVNTGIAFVTDPEGLGTKLANLNNEGADAELLCLLPPAVKTFYESAAYPDGDYGATNVVRQALPYRADIPLPAMLKWPHEENAVRTIVCVGTDADALSSDGCRHDASGVDRLPIYNLLPGQTYYYTVSHIMADGTVTTAKSGSFLTESLPWRLLRISGTQNVRDLGGWAGAGGKKVRYGKLYRGAALDESASAHLLIDDDGRRELLDVLGVRAELDLRWNHTESALCGDISYACLSFSQYAAAITSAEQRAQFKTILEWIVARLGENAPIYMHCQGGCDRTGTMAFLLLGLLGVGESDLAKEYELSSFSPIGMWDRVRNGTVYGYKDMVAALDAYSGETLAERIADFAVNGCGISADILTALRDHMLQS